MLLGSHVDSVPYGGRLDGGLGVVAALEVPQVVKERGISLDTHLEAMDFTDEEGHFVGLMGSRALSGILRAEHLRSPRGDQEDFENALWHAGLSERSVLSAARDLAAVAGYLEVHIEQGMRLIESDIHIGIVTSIAGIRAYEIRFVGRADHAGTTPMDKRSDAAQGACAFTLVVRELVMKEFPDGVANVGNMRFQPGVFNIAPETVTVVLEFRADDEDKLDEMEAVLLRRASAEAQRFGLDLETEIVERVAPAQPSEEVQRAFPAASEALGVRHTFLSSGAGHDAQSLAPHCPVGMIFVPSVGGFSHSSREFTEWEDCVNGANVLLHAALMLGGNRTRINTD